MTVFQSHLCRIDITDNVNMTYITKGKQAFPSPQISLDIFWVYLVMALQSFLFYFSSQSAFSFFFSSLHECINCAMKCFASRNFDVLGVLSSVNFLSLSCATKYQNIFLLLLTTVCHVSVRFPKTSFLLSCPRIS